MAQSQPAWLHPSAKDPRARARVLEEQGTYANLLSPSSFPSPRDGVEHTRRGGSNGYKATTCPTLTPGEPQQGPAPGKCQIAINPPAPHRAAPLPLDSEAAARRLLLAAATAQGEVEAAPCYTLACLSASAGHDALHRSHREVPRHHGAQQTHGHPPVNDKSSQALGHRAKPKTPQAAQTCPLQRPAPHREDAQQLSLCLGASLTNEPCCRFQTGIPR